MIEFNQSQIDEFHERGFLLIRPKFRGSNCRKGLFSLAEAVIPSCNV